MNNYTVRRFSLSKISLLLCVLFVLTAVVAVVGFAPVAKAEGSNSLVSALGSATPYNPGESADFGATPTLTVPYLATGDVASAADFGTASDPLKVSISIVDPDGLTVSVATDVTRKEWADYVNASMPAGNYYIAFKAEGFTQTFSYKVNKVAMPAAALDKLITVAFGKNGARNIRFNDRTGQMQMLDETAQNAIDTFQKALLVERLGVWANAVYNRFYSVDVKYNMDSMRSITEYYTEDEMNTRTDRPVEPGYYEIYYQIESTNYLPLLEVGSGTTVQEFDANRQKYKFTVEIKCKVAVPTVSDVKYNGSVQRLDLVDNSYYTISYKDDDDYTSVGEHELYVVLANSYFEWADGKVGDRYTLKYNITIGENYWLHTPVASNWVEGKFSEEDYDFSATARFGSEEVRYTILDSEGNCYYDPLQSIDRRADMKHGLYILHVTLPGTQDYVGLEDDFALQVWEKEGLPIYATVLIAVGALLIAALILFILGKKGVFQLLTGKLVVAIRTQATIDATIAAIRANKVKEEADKSIAAAKAKERAEALKQAAKEARERPAEEQVAAYEAKAAQAAKRADRMRARSERMQKRADAIKQTTDSGEEVATDVVEEETTPDTDSTEE